METKWIRHPNLPEGQEVEVRADAVRHYAHSGWEVMDAAPDWATVRPEDAALAEMTPERRDAEALKRTDETNDSESTTANDESGDESAEEKTAKPTGSRTRRTPKGDDQ